MQSNNTSESGEIPTYARESLDLCLIWQNGEKVWGVRSKWQTELMELWLTVVWGKVLTQATFYVVVHNIIRFRFNILFCMLPYYIVSVKGESTVFQLHG